MSNLDISTTDGITRYRARIKQDQRMMELYRKRGGASFVLNPATLKPLAPKIGDERHQPVVQDSEVEALKSTLRQKTLVPQEKRDYPLTTSEEVGWFHARYQGATEELFTATHKQADFVAFAERFSILHGVGPFSSKARG
jgi:hypothetical protein